MLHCWSLMLPVRLIVYLLQCTTLFIIIFQSHWRLSVSIIHAYKFLCNISDLCCNLCILLYISSTVCVHPIFNAEFF